MAQNNKATQLWKLLKKNLVRATAVTKRFTSGRLQKLDPVPYCMYEIEYMSVSESDNESVEITEPIIGKGKSWKKKKTPDIEIVEEIITVPDEPMEEAPKWDSYAIHATNMSNKIDRVTSELGLWEMPEPEYRHTYLPTERRTYIIRNPVNEEFIAQTDIPLVISDRLMEELVHKVYQDGYFLPHVFNIDNVVHQVRIGLQDLEQDIDYIMQDAAYEKKRIAAELAKIEYDKRIRQPDTLLSFCARVGPTDINGIINRDDDVELEIYLDILGRTGYYPRPENLMARMAYHDSIKCFRLIIERMNNWNPHAYDEALMYRPGVGLVSQFWAITSQIVLAWGAERIRSWMRSMLLYQPGTYCFPTGPVSELKLFIQRRVKYSYDNGAPFLPMQEPQILTNRTADQKGFGNIVISSIEEYKKDDWN